MTNTINYIANTLQNQEAAAKLLDDIEVAILKRLNAPLSFEPFPSSKKRKHQYFRIYVHSFTVYYVVIDDVMEVRRLIYSKRNADSIL
ncbi:MAG: type II toxin-antitoxin system RelE/ParE family toxin [Selenomonadaceae bacterium]|nr:type II toxin-antitoxin system RelE/ParE family toxin [Selenomonadaceae bacterium]